jgi:hypothetical protein
MRRRGTDVSIETAHDPTRSRVIAAGEMDLACLATFNRAMSKATVRGVPVVLDLSCVTFVDSRFAAAVGGWERELGQGRLTLMLPPDVRLKRLVALRSRPGRMFRPSSELAETGAELEAEL